MYFKFANFLFPFQLFAQTGATFHDVSAVDITPRWRYTPLDDIPREYATPQYVPTFQSLNTLLEHAPETALDFTLVNKVLIRNLQ